MRIIGDVPFEPVRTGGIALHRVELDEGARLLALAGGAGLVAQERATILQREFSLRHALNPKWAARPCELIRRDDLFGLLLEDPGGITLRRECGQALPIERFLSLAVALSSALCDMHAQGIVHHDLRPENVLVDVRGEAVYLTGFGHATSAESSAGARVLTFAGDEDVALQLAYAAPETISRLGSSADARADLYSLGCVLYELLTGRPVLSGKDIAAIEFSQMVRRPLAPREVSSHVPKQLSDIILKLLEKAPEDRYQTARGVFLDLQRCWAMWRESARIDWFALDRQDVVARIDAQRKIFGREREIALLTDAVKKAGEGALVNAVVVCGPSGVGKSSLVAEARRRGFGRSAEFAAGKCEQGRASVPYACVVQALDGLLRHGLGLDEHSFAGWRAKVLSKLGQGASLLQRLLPDLRLVVGDPVPVPALSARDEERRLQSALVRFVEACVVRGQPLVLFLDDLQWADSGTLAFVDRLMASTSLRGVFLVAALRQEGSECSLIFPAERATQVQLGPLPHAHVAALVRESLDCDAQTAEAIAAVVDEKTLGNPLHARQFLADLARESLISPSVATIPWNIDFVGIQRQGYAANVVDLVLQKLDALPELTLQTLQYLACLGSHASLNTLGHVLELEPNVLLSRLQPAIATHRVFRRADSVHFWHDRIREAVHLSIPAPKRAGVHLAIGRKLLPGSELSERFGTVFDVVEQVNQGRAEVSSPLERVEFARANKRAGERAAATAAYASALRYFEAAASFLDGGADTELAAEIELRRGLYEFLTGALVQAESRLEQLADRSLGSPLGASLARLRCEIYTTKAQLPMALEVGFKCLERVGLHMPRRPNDGEVDAEHKRLLAKSDELDFATLGTLASPRESEWREAIEQLSSLIPAALYTDRNLLDFLLLKLANVSLEHGHSHGSCFGYGALMLVLGQRYQEYELATKFAELAKELVGDSRFAAELPRTYMCYGALVTPWSASLSSGYSFLRRAFKAATECGDLTHAAHCNRHLVSHSLAAGGDLAETQAEAEQGLTDAMAIGFDLVADILRSQLMVVRALRGLPSSDSTASGGEKSAVAQPGGANSGALAKAAFWIRQLHLRYLFGDLPGALEAEQHAAELSWVSRSIELVDFHFYGALAHATALRTYRRGAAKATHRVGFERHRSKLAEWAQVAPQNFVGRLALADAERARAEGKLGPAESGYEDTIRHSREHGFLHIEALAAELAADFYMERGIAVASRAYGHLAGRAYAGWGAAGKVRHLESKFPARVLEPDASHSERARKWLRGVDADAVSRAATAISGEIELDRLVETLMSLTLSTAGAQRGCLVFMHEKVPFMQAEAEATDDSIAVTIRRDAALVESVPAAIAQTVMRTAASVVIDDFRLAPEFSRDSSASTSERRSVLCLPMIRHGELTGLLYAENNLMAGAFGRERIAVLEILSTLAAGALEGARLHEALVGENTQRQSAEHALRSARAELSRASETTSMGLLVASIVHEVSQPIGAVGGFASAALRWLAHQPPELDEARDMLTSIVSSSTRADAVIQGLRALALRRTPTFSVFDLNRAVAEIVAIKRSELHDRGVPLVEQGLNVPALVSGDRIQLQQVVHNLLLNAQEAVLDAATDRPEICIYSECDGEHVEIRVSDSGRGIDPLQRERVFDPFVTTKAAGMGMGLAICHSIVQAHDGEIGIGSSTSPGATFYFRLALDK